MSTPAAKPGTGWTVTYQVPESQVGPGNVISEGMRVHFKTQYNGEGSVWVPTINYTAEVVKQAIVEQATTMDAIHTLSS